MKYQKYGVIFAALFWFSVAALIWISLVPDITFRPKKIDLGIMVRKEALTHFFGHVLITWLFIKAYGISRMGVIGLLLLGTISEAVNYFVEGRGATLDDLLLNIAGVLTGIVLGSTGAICAYVRKRVA